MKKIDIESIREDLNNIISNYSSYEEFSSDRDNAYDYAEKFKISVCPYCNINYIYVVKNKKGNWIRPEFDHFIKKTAKGGRPDLALNVDNIVPSCHECNSSLKNQKTFSEDTNLHPLKKDFDSIAEFYLQMNNTNYLNKDAFDISFARKLNASEQDFNLAKKNIDVFKLIERYAHHKAAVIDVLRELKIYHSAKLKDINRIMNSGNTEDKYIIRRIYNYKNIDINNESLGKLKKDIATKYS